MSSSKHKCSDHYELKTYAKLFTCDGCKTNGYGQRYRCEPCGRELHKECRFPATTAVSHEYFPGSTFKFRRDPLTKLDRNGRRQYTKWCNACRRDICGSSYRCDATDKDLHPCCRKLDKKLVVDGATTFDLRAGAHSKCSWCEKKKAAGAERDVRGWTYESSCKKFNFHVCCMAEIMQEASTKSSVEMGLESVDLMQLARNGGSGAREMFQMIIMVLKIISAAFLGDPKALVTDVIVELVSRGLQGCARFCQNLRNG